MSNISFKKITLTLFFGSINQSEKILLIKYQKNVTSYEINFLDFLIINFLCYEMLKFNFCY